MQEKNASAFFDLSNPAGVRYEKSLRLFEVPNLIRDEVAIFEKSLC
jgi:hypothetical protein